MPCCVTCWAWHGRVCRTRPLTLHAWAQVKLRGFRVELGEIEHALSEVPSVQLAVALVLRDPTGMQSLVAYVTPASIDPAAVTAELKGRLPAHMVPSAVVPLERMPLLPNEKVDRKALPVPDWGTRTVEEYVAPASELEAQIQAVWQEVLGQERVSTHADFFAIGGNSLQVRCPALHGTDHCMGTWHDSNESQCIYFIVVAVVMLLQQQHDQCAYGMTLRCCGCCFETAIKDMAIFCLWLRLLCVGRQAGKVMIRVRQAVGRDVPTVQLFRTPTIAGLADALGRTAGAAARGEAASQAIPRAGFSAEQRAAGVPCSANQEQMLVLHQMAPASAAYNMAEPVRLRGALDEAALEVPSAHACCILLLVHPYSHHKVHQVLRKVAARG